MTLSLLLSLLFASAVVVPEAPTLEGDAALAVEDARKAMNEGRYTDAALIWGTLADAGGGPELRYLQGLALYEAGEVVKAAEALRGIDTPAAWNLRGLALVEAGRPSEGMVLLEKARGSSDPASVAHATLNIGRVEADRGHPDKAKAAFEAAQKLDPGLKALADAALEDLAAQDDPVGIALRQGRAANARSEAKAMPRNTPRQRVQADIAQAAVLRATGQPAAAIELLVPALGEARAAGMAWEVAQALFGIGVCHTLTGHPDLARDFLAKAESEALAAGFMAVSVEYGAEAGLAEIRLDRVDPARTRLGELDARLQGMEHPVGRARVEELRGGVLARSAQKEPALAAYRKAISTYEARAWWTDCARVATAMVRTTGAQAEVDKALVYFQKAGDPLGPAHVELARGLALAEQKDLEGALGAFAKAAEAARKVGGPHGELVAQVAEEDAAKTLVALGASPEIAAKASSEGTRQALAVQKELSAAMAAYDQGLELYQAGKYAEAEAAFDKAANGMTALGENAYALKAMRARAWARYNTAVALPPEKAFPIYGALVTEAARLGETELQARSWAATALSGAAIGKRSDRQLEDAALFAEKAGLPSVAARCWTELATAGTFDEREARARKAYTLAPEDPGAVYAMYALSVDACNAGEYDRAQGLARDVLPRAGKLGASVQGVIDACHE